MCCANAESFLARRLDTLQRALQGAGAGGPLPYVLIENSSKCNTNDSGEKVLPNGTVWLPQLMRKVSTSEAVKGNADVYVKACHCPCQPSCCAEGHSQQLPS